MDISTPIWQRFAREFVEAAIVSHTGGKDAIPSYDFYPMKTIVSLPL